MSALANAENMGVANISSMIVPCMVKNWLKDSYDRYCSPGKANSARIASANRPPNPK